MKHVLKHFEKNDPILYKAAVNIELILPNRGSDYFRNLVRSIIGQQLSVKAASTIFGRFEVLTENEITPEKIVTIPDSKLREAGISYSKIAYIKEFSQSMLDKKIIFDDINELTDEEVLAHLIQIKGIGRWTAEMFLMFTLGREDIFSHGDAGLQRAIKNLYGIEKYDFEVFEKLSLNWSPYRTYACYVLWQTLDNEPK